uniref:Secreted protein n=1 Tax=Rodentolepis nana TaxID=102285 RepID=A0A0R3TWX7_RODNA
LCMSDLHASSCYLGIRLFLRPAEGDCWLAIFSKVSLVNQPSPLLLLILSSFSRSAYSLSIPGFIGNFFSSDNILVSFMSLQLVRKSNFILADRIVRLLLQLYRQKYDNSSKYALLNE